MNGLKLPKHMWSIQDSKDNVYEMRTGIYKVLLEKMLKRIDKLFNISSVAKLKDIDDRSPTISPFLKSFCLFYRGVEIPILDKNVIILDGVEYIPTLQIVDKPIHTQKDGKFIIVKTNIRNAYVKLDGKENLGIVLNRGGMIPLFMYIMPMCHNDVHKLLNTLGYRITTDALSAGYVIPNYSGNKEAIYVLPETPGKWRDFLLAPYKIGNFNWHIKAIEGLQPINLKNQIEVLFTFDEELSDDEELEEKLEETLTTNGTESEEEIKTKEFTKDMLNTNTVYSNICDYILAYFLSYKRGRKNLTKLNIATTLYKLITPDLTMNNISVQDLIVDCVKNDLTLPIVSDIGDISQKMLRFMEWYPMKLSSVRSFPEKKMITEVAKTEQKLVYNNTLNPITELAMMSRANLFGRGGLPRESCQTNVRNLHDSYYGVIDPISTPSGQNVGVSLHVVPEVCNLDLGIEVSKVNKRGHLFNQKIKREDNKNA